MLRTAAVTLCIAMLAPGAEAAARRITTPGVTVTPEGVSAPGRGL
jgi:hypothetical protein